MSVQLAEQVVLVGLQQLFDPSKWFDVCRVQALCKLVNARMTPTQDALFSGMHCVHYNTMPAGMREKLAQEVVLVLQERMPGLEFSVNKPPVTATVVVVQPERPTGVLRRLLGVA